MTDHAKSDAAFLAAATVGSEFYRHHAIQWGGQSLDEIPVAVTKVTPRQLVLANGIRLRRDNGRIVGAASYSRASYLPATPERVAEMAQAKRFADARDRLGSALESVRAKVGIKLQNSAKLSDILTMTAELEAFAERWKS